jgi:hypothetical protein
MADALSVEHHCALSLNASEQSRLLRRMLDGAVRNAVGIWWRGFQQHEPIVSGGKVNWLSDKVFSERLPAINLTHVDLTRNEQCPKHHGGGFCRRQRGLGFDPSLGLFVQPCWMTAPLPPSKSLKILNT